MPFLFLSGHLTRKFTEIRTLLKIIFIPRDREVVNKVNLCHCPFLRLPRQSPHYWPICHLTASNTSFHGRGYILDHCHCKGNMGELNEHVKIIRIIYICWHLEQIVQNYPWPAHNTQHPPYRKYQNKFVKNQRHKFYSKIIICNPDMLPIWWNASITYQNQHWDPAYW